MYDYQPAFAEIKGRFTEDIILNKVTLGFCVREYTIYSWSEKIEEREAKGEVRVSFYSLLFAPRFSFFSFVSFSFVLISTSSIFGNRNGSLTDLSTS